MFSINLQVNLRENEENKGSGIDDHLRLLVIRKVKEQKKKE